MAKELNPSPKYPQGEYPELSPNPKFENGLVDKTNEKPNGSEQTNPQEKPTIFKGNVFVEGGKLYVNGKEVSTDDYDDKGFDILELTDVSGTLTNAQYNLALSNQCLIKLGTQFFYKEFDAATLLSYKAFVRNSSGGTLTNEFIEITKSTKGWVLHQDIAVKVNPTLEGTEGEVEGLEVSGVKYKAHKLLDAYPIGAIYASAVNTSPAGSLGGTWTELGVHYLPKGNVPVITGDISVPSVLNTELKLMKVSSFDLQEGYLASGSSGGLFAYGSPSGVDPNYVYPANLWAKNTDTTSNTALYLWQRVA